MKYEEIVWSNTMAANWLYWLRLHCSISGMWHFIFDSLPHNSTASSCNFPVLSC